jgi:hypothetical protein
MSTARAIAELRGIHFAEGADEAVVEYLRRSRSVLSQAAHDIERNRYSLQQMDGQMQRLDEVAKRVFPEEAAAATGEPGGETSVEPASGADDGGADGKVSARQ